jgi:hypothetical protein
MRVGGCRRLETALQDTGRAREQAGGRQMPPSPLERGCTAARAPERRSDPGSFRVRHALAVHNLGALLRRERERLFVRGPKVSCRGLVNDQHALASRLEQVTREPIEESAGGTLRVPRRFQHVLRRRAVLRIEIDHADHSFHSQRIEMNHSR